MPRQRRPVDVPDDDAAARPDDAHQLGERGVDVAEVLEDLDGNGTVDRRVADRELRRLALEQADVRPVAGLAAGDREHRRAGVDACDRAVGADDVEDVDDVEPGPAADVEHVVARPGGKCLLGERAPPFDVARAVDDLKPRGDAFVEIELIRHRWKRCTSGPALRRTRTWDSAAGAVYARAAGVAGSVQEMVERLATGVGPFPGWPSPDRPGDRGRDGR